MGCLEGRIATSEGTGSVSIQDGSNGDSIGPIIIPSKIHKAVRKFLASGTEIPPTLEAEWDKVNQEIISISDVVRMVEEGATQDHEYYLLLGEDFVFGPDPEILRQEWLESLTWLPSDWELWEDMETDSIEDILCDLKISIPVALEDEEEEDDDE